MATNTPILKKITSLFRKPNVSSQVGTNVPRAGVDLWVDLWGVKSAGKTVVLAFLKSLIESKAKGVHASRALEEAINVIGEYDQSPKETSIDEQEFLDFTGYDGKRFCILSRAGENFDDSIKGWRKTANALNRVPVLVVNPFVLDKTITARILIAVAIKLQKHQRANDFYEAVKIAAQSIIHPVSGVPGEEASSTLQTELGILKERVAVMLKAANIGGKHPFTEGDYSLRCRKEGNTEKWTAIKTGEESVPINIEGCKDSIANEIATFASKCFGGDSIGQCKTFVNEVQNSIVVLTHLDIFDYIGESPQGYLEKIITKLVGDRDDLDGRIVPVKGLDHSIGIPNKDHEGFAKNPLGFNHLWRAIQNQLAAKPSAQWFNIAGRLAWTLLPTVLFVCLFVHTTLDGIRTAINTPRHRSEVQVPFSQEFSEAIDTYSTEKARWEFVTSIQQSILAVLPDSAETSRDPSHHSIDVVTTYGDWKWLRKFVDAEIETNTVKQDVATELWKALHAKVTSHDQNDKQTAPLQKTDLESALKQFVKDSENKYLTAKSKVETKYPAIAEVSLSLADQVEKIRMEKNKNLMAPTDEKISFFAVAAQIGKPTLLFPMGSLLLFFWQTFVFAYLGPKLFSDLYSLFRSRIRR